jgi:hypothetical protein
MNPSDKPCPSCGRPGMNIAETYYEDVVWCPNCGTLVDVKGVHAPASRENWRCVGVSTQTRAECLDQLCRIFTNPRAYIDAHLLPEPGADGKWILRDAELDPSKDPAQGDRDRVHARRGILLRTR